MAIRRTNFWNKRPKSRKETGKKPRLVSVCDYCGKKLVVSHERTYISAIASMIDDNPARKINSEWRFFCSKKCLERYAHGEVAPAKDQRDT